jgi:signal transduction histidine kinase
MRVAGRIATGSGLVLVLLAATVGYQLALVRSIARGSHELAGSSFRAANDGLDLINQLDTLEESARKFFVTRDPAYAARAADARDAFAGRLEDVLALALSERERFEADRLAATWRQFGLASVPAAGLGAALAAASEGQLLEAVAAPLERLRRQSWALVGATRSEIAARVARSDEANERARRVSSAAVGGAVALGVGVVLLTVRSINRPLHRLTEGTRAVARGDFSSKVEASTDDEFADLARDFNEMLDALRQLDGLKRDFVSHVSHELRTPLVAMQETTRLLLEASPGPLTAKQRRLLDLNLQASERLAAMISDLLDLSRVEAGVMRYELGDHDLSALVRRATAELEARAAERGVALRLSAPARPVPVRCDGDRVIQVAQNLIENAIKFSPQGAAVDVRVDGLAALPPDLPNRWRRVLGPGPSANGWARLIVDDAGPGVADADKERIFEKFYQAGTASSRPAGGVGLGLAITRAIVSAHGGAIWIVDREESGSRFAVVVPAARASEPAAGRPAAGTAQA